MDVTEEQKEDRVTLYLLKRVGNGYRLCIRTASAEEIPRLICDGSWSMSEEKCRINEANRVTIQYQKALAAILGDLNK